MPRGCYMKQTLQNRFPRRWLLLAFVLNFAIAAAALLPYMIRDGGLLLVAADFDAEQLSYNMLCNNAIKSGEVLWNWRIDIGSDFVSSFSFYTLGSPFFWLSFLFPASAFPYLVGWIYMLKYAVAGLTSFAYFRRSASEKSALLGSVLYAFSGFSCINVVFYHFNGVIALFSLLMLGLDKRMQEGKKAPFLFAVTINALVNYYFFIGEVFFLVFYYITRYLFGGEDARPGADLRKNARKIPACILEGCLGVGMAGVLFIPSIAAVLNNPRVSDHISLSQLTFDWPNYLQMLRALFFPAENMFNFSAVVHDNWYSIAAYLPLVGVCLVLAYLLRWKWDWLHVLLVGLFLVAASPVSNSLFVMFTSEPYRRWYYMLVFLLVLATIKVLDHLQDYPWRAGCGISAAVIAAITLYLYVKRDTIVYRKYWLVVLTLIAIGGVVLLFAALGGVRRLRLRRPMAALTACTALVAALTTGFTVGTYQRAYTQTIGLTTTEIYGDVIHSGDGLPDALPYRYYFWEPYSNRGMAAYLPDRTSFLSTLSPSIFTLYDALGDERHAITPAGPEGTNELLSVGYYIRNNSDWPDEIYTSFSNGHEQINVYQDSHALPIGFCYDTYMTRSEFDEIDPAERAHAMLKTLVVADEDEATVSTILRHYDAALDGEISQENKYADMDKRREACTDVFDYGTDYFYSEITSGSEQYAFFSVPYDKAWSATVNGESAEILNINGLMAVKVNAGKNCIRFHYSPTPLWCGIGVSAISILLTAIYLLAGRRSRKSKKEVL